MRLALVETLFDYRPDEWFGAADYDEPPPRRDATREAREQLRRLAEIARSHVALTAAQRDAVERVLEEIGEAP